MDAQAHVVAAQQFVDVLAVPGGIAELENVLVLLRRERLQENLQALRVDVPIRRQLEQYRSQLLFQKLHARKKCVEARIGISQALDVGQKPATLDRETEVGWGLLAPTLHRRFGREAIETIVDLDSLEMTNIPGKVLRRL